MHLQSVVGMQLMIQQVVHQLPALQWLVQASLLLLQLVKWAGRQLKCVEGHVLPPGLQR